MNKRRISEDFAGTQRFEIMRCIGAGGMGTVYEAFDRERKERVALKTLRAMNAESLLRFKHEFREFQDLSHPNLVSVGELFSDEGDWFFTMELLDGVDFLDYVRPGLARASGASSRDTLVSLPPIMESARTMRVSSSGSLLNEARLRTALRQLAFGLYTLHEANKVHRDIKPSNILVTERGRVVLLDFGLATELEGREHQSEVDIVGTVEYMAPEQAAARQVGPPADWYSVGVVLFEALTGQLPLVGPAIEVLMNKQRLDAPSPRTLNPAAPEDLTELCMDLMRFNPAQRPTGKQVLDRLGAALSAPSPAASLSSFSTSSSFVGRERELEQLKERFDRSRQAAQTVLVHGESGLGKSALVRRFVEQLKEREGGVVTLAGTCYERESVPFKAVDGLVDALSQYMRRLPKAEAAALLPRRAGLLAQVFPVLQRVEAVAEAPRAAEDVLDPQELRNRLFAALRELLSRITDRHPLVLVIDDLQWADADSLAMLAELMQPPDAPTLLLIATVRSQETSSGPVRRQSLDEQLRGEVHHLQLGRMSPDEARELAQILVRRAPGQTSLNAMAIAAEAGGHPLFIDELIRHAVAVGGAQGPLQLDEALWARVSQLEPDARRVLEIVALAGGRLVQQTAAQAALMTFADFAKQVGVLRVAHLVRTTGMRATDAVEPYHDRVRKAVFAKLDGSTIRHHHHRLAIALETSGQVDPEALAVHWREAGNTGKAVHFARAAAEKAAKALAFDRAADFYEISIELLGPSTPRELLIRYADALANAGRGGEAGAAYLKAAADATPSMALDLQRRAAEQLLISGHIDDGLTTLRAVLKSAGMKIAATPRQALWHLMQTRIQLRLRGLTFRQREQAQIPLDDLRRLDICWSAGIALGLVDSLRGADFQARHLLLALRAGEPYRVARALAMESGYVALAGSKSADRCTRLQHAASALADSVAIPHAVGLTRLMAGIGAFLQGQWRVARANTEEAQSIFRDKCTGVAWELDNAQLYPLWARIFLGELQDLRALASSLLTEAQVRGDRYLETNLRTRVLNMVHLGADRPDEAAREVETGIAGWSHHGFHLQHYFALHSLTEIDLYRGCALEAERRIEEAWSQLVRSDFWHLQLMRIETKYLRARCLIAAAAADSNRSHRLSAAERCAKEIRSEKAAWAEPLDALICAAIAAARDEQGRSRTLLERAHSGFLAADMSMHAAAVRYWQGAVDEAGERLRLCGVVNATAVAKLLAPGFL